MRGAAPPRDRAEAESRSRKVWIGTGLLLPILAPKERLTVASSEKSLKSMPQRPICFGLSETFHHFSEL